MRLRKRQSWTWDSSFSHRVKKPPRPKSCAARRGCTRRDSCSIASPMPIATPAQYRAMLDAAQKGDYAYPAINVTSLPTINGALKAFAESKVGRHHPGEHRRRRVRLGHGGQGHGARARSCWPKRRTASAQRYNVLIALHTDHCQPKKVDAFLKPLIAATAKRRAAGLGNLFNSHMLDASELPLDENMKLSKALLKECAEHEIILEVEAGVVGGEEDGRGPRGSAERETLHHSRGHGRGVRGAARPRPLHVRRHVRQRPRQLQARRGEAQAHHPAGRPGGRDRQARRRPRSSTSSSTAAPARRSRRSARRSPTAS